MRDEPDAVEPIELDSSALGGSPKKRQHDQLVDETPVKAKEEVKENPYHNYFALYVLFSHPTIKMFYVPETNIMYLTHCC
jgi:hypothetical protein